MMLLEDLGSGETLVEWCDSSSVEEPEPGADLEREKSQPNTGGHGSRKRNPRLPTGSECGPHNLKDPSNLRNRHHFSVGNRLVKRTSRLVERCYGVQVFQPFRDN